MKGLYQIYAPVLLNLFHVGKKVIKCLSSLTFNIFSQLFNKFNNA